MFCLKNINLYPFEIMQMDFYTDRIRQKEGTLVLVATIHNNNNLIQETALGAKEVIRSQGVHLIQL